ncbi:MBL fold metallo-hydrolase [Paenibacillaceae bacterium WGS1546]|uniref:MBL fold metallo-hydrolase n=1 Tax=Cohnella sp. WGS1546 TaxID=3366810 RepID=UPI00372D37CB
MMIQYRDDCVTVYQSALYQTTTTVILTEAAVIVVDPNWLPAEIEEIRAHVRKSRGKRDVYLLFTHGDFDHILGYRAFPSAKAIGSVGLREHPGKAQQLQQIRDFDQQYYVSRDYPIEFPELDFAIGEDGRQLRLGDATLTFYLAPGHTEDGLMTVVEPFGILIAGDYLSDIEKPFVSHSAKAYAGTIRKAESILDRHAIRLLVPGHGRATADPAEMKERARTASDYLERLRRAVVENDEHALEALGKEHAFPSAFTEASHQENIRIVSREYV